MSEEEEEEVVEDVEARPKKEMPCAKCGQRVVCVCESERYRVRKELRRKKLGPTRQKAAFARKHPTPADVDALVISMNDAAMIDEYLGASGTDVSRHDLRLLGAYAARNGRGYCQHGCNACAQSCPAGVPIAEVLRTRMYAVDYGDLAYAREDYARLGAGASACAGCASQACTAACPSGLAVAKLTREAGRLRV